MNLIRRYWVVGLVLSMVVVHAVIISYVRSQVARLNQEQSSTIPIGHYRFQHVSDLTQVFSFRLHVVVDPQRRHSAEEQLGLKELEINETVEQLLRQAPTELLNDPTQTVLRDRLMEAILGHITDPIIQRVVITEWLVLPASTPQLPSISNLADA